MQKKYLADGFSGLFFLLAGLGVVVEAWRMPHFSERGVDSWTVPGIMPGFVGTALFILGFLLLIRSFFRYVSIRAAAKEKGIEAEDQKVDVSLNAIVGLPSIVICLLLGTLYVYFIGSVSFTLLTFLFLFTFSLVFEIPKLRQKELRLKRLLIILIYAAFFSTALPYLFEKVFLVRLP